MYVQGTVLMLKAKYYLLDLVLEPLQIASLIRYESNNNY